jgi:hypothetical protein
MTGQCYAPFLIGHTVSSDPDLDMALGKKFCAPPGVALYRAGLAIRSQSLSISDMLNMMQPSTGDLFNDTFHPLIDQSDNEAQMKILKKHYLDEFSRRSIDMVLKDYSDESVIYEVLDNIPTTYHGEQGARRMLNRITGLAKDVDLHHISVNRNHAQVFWTANMDSRDVIHGTDSFEFDKDNRIKAQTIVALTIKQDGK